MRHIRTERKSRSPGRRSTSSHRASRGRSGSTSPRPETNRREDASNHPSSGSQVAKYRVPLCPRTNDTSHLQNDSDSGPVFALMSLDLDLPVDSGIYLFVFFLQIAHLGIQSGEFFVKIFTARAMYPPPRFICTRNEAPRNPPQRNLSFLSLNEICMSCVIWKGALMSGVI